VSHILTYLLPAEVNSVGIPAFQLQRVVLACPLIVQVWSMFMS